MDRMHKCKNDTINISLTLRVTTAIMTHFAVAGPPRVCMTRAQHFVIRCWDWHDMRYVIGPVGLKATSTSR
jgi:hypothetical protein